MSNCPLTVVVFGHSFVRRLRGNFWHIPSAKFPGQCTNNAWVNLNFDPETVSVVFHGIGGLTLPRAFKELDIVREVSPDVIFLQLGENDVDKVDSCPREIVRLVTQLTAAILRNSPKTKHVFWGQLLHRPSPRISSSTYSEKIHTVNKILRLQTSENLQYWPHKGLWQDPASVFSFDGVHLNTRGHHKLARSIRGAILRHRALTAVKSVVSVPQDSVHRERSVPIPQIT